MSPRRPNPKPIPYVAKDGTCPKCGHGWGSHQRAPSMGDRCVQMVSYPRQCGCTEDNPDRVAEDQRARAAWNGLMGR